jgi:hypothetical protein
MTLTFDTDRDGEFECNGDDNCWNFGGTTGSNGEVAFTLKRADLGSYQALVTDVSHSTYTYTSGLDADNPAIFSLQ